MPFNYPARYNDDGFYSPISKIISQSEVQYCRCGIVPYYFDENGDIFFVFGVNRDKIFQLSSFGGKSKQDESWEDCSIREFNEESYSLLAHLTRDDVKNGIMVASQKCILTFVEITTVNEFYTFDLIKKLTEGCYVDNMTNGKKCDQWETITVEKFNQEQMVKLLNRESIEGKILWDLDRIIILNVWCDLIKLLMCKSTRTCCLDTQTCCLDGQSRELA